MFFGSRKGFTGTGFGATRMTVGADAGAGFGAAAAATGTGAAASLACSPAHAATIAVSITERTALAIRRISLSSPCAEPSRRHRRYAGFATLHPAPLLCDKIH